MKKSLIVALFSCIAVLAAAFFLKTTAEASLLSIAPPENGAFSVAVFSEEDFCSAEIGATAGAKSVFYRFSELLDDSFDGTGKEPANVVFLLSGTKEVTGEDGTVPSASELKKIVNRLRRAYDYDVPVVWVALSARESGSEASLYRNLCTLEETPSFRNFYAGYTFLSGEESGRESLAKRAVLPFSFLFPREEAEAPEYTDLVFYVSETGSDSANGASPSTALQSCKPVKTLLTNRFGGLTKLPRNARIVIEVSGKVVQSVSQVMFHFAESPTDADGNRIPLLVETYGYDEKIDNRAEIRCDFRPHDDGSSRMSIACDTVFRNVKITTLAEAKDAYAIHYLYGDHADIVFDNTTFESGDGVPFQLSPCNNIWSQLDDVPEGVVLHSSMKFVNGYYGDSTGVGFVAGVNTPYLWRASDQGGSVYRGLMRHSTVIVSENATVERLYALTTYYKTEVLPTDGVDVIVEKGGAVGHLAATYSRNSRYTYHGDVNILVDGGTILSSLSGVGTNAVYDGALAIEIRDSRIAMVPEGESGDSPILSRADAVITKDMSFTMENSILAVKCGLNVPSSLRMIGNGGEINGAAAISIANSTIVMLPNEKLTNADASLLFGMENGKVNGKVTETIENALIDVSALPDPSVVFFGKNASFQPIAGNALTLSVKNAHLYGNAFFLPLSDQEGSEVGGETLVTIENVYAGGVSSFSSSGPKFSGNVSITLKNSAFDKGESTVTENFAGGYELDRSTSTFAEFFGDENEKESGESETYASESGNESGEKTAALPFWIFPAGGGVLLVIAVSAVILVRRSKKKSASKETA